MVIAPGMLRLKRRHLLQPWRDLQPHGQRRQQQVQIATQRHVRLTHFAQLRRIDIQMDHLRLRCKGIKAAGNPIVKAGADGDQQITLLHRQIGRLTAVHSQHPG